MSMVISYRLSNIIDRSQIEDISIRFKMTLANAESLPELEQLIDVEKFHVKLVVCDLPTMMEKDSDLRDLVSIIKRHNIKTLGKYPHVRGEIAKKAKSYGFDYVVPNSIIRIMLEKILREI